VVALSYELLSKEWDRLRAEVLFIVPPIVALKLRPLP